MPTCPARAAALEPTQAEPKIAMGTPEQPDTVVQVSAYIPACPMWQMSISSHSTEVPAPREPGALAPSIKISDPIVQRHVPDAPSLLAAPSSCCGCGCGAAAPVAKTDHRSGAVAGQPRRFIRGHAARLQHRRAEFSVEHFWGRVEKGAGSGCWLSREIQITVAGRRVYAAHVALLLHQDRAVTPEALAKLRLRRRCGRHRRCVNPAHVVPLIRRESGSTRRADAITAARAKMAAWKAGRAG